ncbi:class D beta-lactamase [Hymenobacter elongatus]|uniref:class D beta-lactamase n=1 Tax=Hymenobacter elongatus TaxID=877208 RepID=UPI001436B96B|nr:class D beta-lactamase [Hymenobacter elongatus]
MLVLGGPVATAQRILQRNFQPYFEAHELRGSFLLLDVSANQYTAYDLPRCRQGFLPASTFKIPNTLIGLETAAVRDTAEVFRWDGRVRSFAQWNQDMTLARALRVSCVPCYQQLARRIGAGRYQHWLPKLRFGRMVVTPTTIDSFWLVGQSRITQFEQINFLRRLQREQLPVSRRSQELTKTLLVLSRGPGWVMRGKTGWTMQQGHDNGWFVGWVEQGRKIYFFALNVEPKHAGPVTAKFVQGRRAVTEQILRQEFGLLSQ